MRKSTELVQRRYELSGSVERPSMIEDGRYAVGMTDEDTTRMEGNRFIGYELLMVCLFAKKSAARKNHGIYTVSVIKDMLGIWG